MYIVFGLGRDSSKRAHQLYRFAKVTLGPDCLQKAVKLPSGEDKREWIAVHAADFYTQTSLLYSTITEFCTVRDCPVMSAGDKYQYRWLETGPLGTPRAVALSAPEYVDNVMRWGRRVIDDPHLFPNQPGAPFVRTFLSTVRTLFKRLFRVYAHIYHAHFDAVLALSEEAHLNTSFKHFVLFAREFDLLDTKELRPVADLITLLTGTPV
ncbi:Mob1/phocein [Thamnocephalis sphaerospora]|uniref:Mob1/phocein n=1 Tax=Thamnocephalis sphaerospora TaxID=78915 RepID=A0A4P9XYJ1_9FUNG|nr:Mob1/phocein [Thamnocephalis sphaerospora]|eukprot:RKP10771.1 Mob1/phocein [Thamnocephalis sphaerospora]